MATTELSEAAAAPFARHVAQRTVVLADLKLLFLPVPKSACTTILWLLSDLAGIPAERFEKSLQPEVSPALTVHDMSLWEPEHRLSFYEDEDRERVLTEDGWLRFAIVRNPATRVWSAWQSKLLLREPRFVDQFADEDYFPGIPQEPFDLVEGFRAFVAALNAPDPPVDVHWAVQHDLVDQLPLNHIGRVESFGETMQLLREHVGEARWPQTKRRENRTPFSLPPAAYDEAAAAVLADVYRADAEAFGYPLPPAPGTSEEQAAWEARVAPLLAMARDAIDEHGRVGAMHRAAQERLAVQRQQREEREARQKASRRAQLVTSRSPWLPNAEGNEDFDVTWGWSEGELANGFTAVLRLKDEARSLPWTLPPLLRAVQRIVIVDNGSTDGTPDIARQIAAEHDAAERLEVHAYPFAIAPCGAEHLSTPADSLHSLAYYYNWSFAHVRTNYALKWDGDMVLTDAAASQLRDLAWQLESVEAIIRVPRVPLYLADDRRAYLDLSVRNVEAWGWPNRPGYSFVKAMEWELPLWGSKARSVVLPSWGCVELKHLDADEFAHWSDTNFDQTSRTARKRREWEVFQALTTGAPAPDEVERIDAPEGVHVIEHVRDVVLPKLAREAG
jgi:hypothetical protein